MSVRLGAAWLGLACLSAGPAAAASADDVLQALTTICEPASAKAVAVRDLAEQTGWTREAAPPSVVLAQFPITQMGSASFVKRFPDGDLHVVSTVLPPPATPFSCLVAVDGVSPDFVAGLGSKLPGYHPLPVDPKLDGIADSATFNRADKRSGVVDKVMALRALAGVPDHLNAFVLAYRVDDSSAAAARALSKDRP